MTPAVLDLEVPRNGSDYREYHLRSADDEVIDITGWAIAANARDMPGGTVIATGAVTVLEPVNGLFSVKWLGSQFDTYGDAQGLATAAYDIKATDASGLPIVPVRGTLYLTSEATA